MPQDPALATAATRLWNQPITARVSFCLRPVVFRIYRCCAAAADSQCQGAVARLKCARGSAECDSVHARGIGENWRCSEKGIQVAAVTLDTKNVSVFFNFLYLLVKPKKELKVVPLKL